MTVVDIATKQTAACPTRSKLPAKHGFLLQDLDPVDSSILKALAITVICLHNFLHLITPVRQNEFSFDPARFTLFLQSAQHPSTALQAFFSFFGHYGVQVFVFLSAYGLAKAHWNTDESWSTFMWGRIRKLYPTFLVIVGGWAVGDAVLLGPVLFIKQMGLHLVLLLLGVSTLAGYGLPLIGPWWFIPFIVQFYAIWPFLRKLTHRFGWRALLALSLASLTVTWFADPLLRHWSLNLLYTPLGRLPVLCLGIAAARYPFRLRGYLTALALAVLLLGSHYGALWLFTMPAATLITLWTYVRVRTALRSFAWLSRLGEYSLLVFLLNAIVRNHRWLFVHSPGLQLLAACASTALSFVLAAIIHWALTPGTHARDKAPSTISHPEPQSSMTAAACMRISRTSLVPAQE